MTSAVVQVIWMALFTFLAGTSARRARIPPSPALSAFMMKVRYFTVTTIVSDQTMRDRMPSRFSCVGGTPWLASTHSLTA